MGKWRLVLCLLINKTASESFARARERRGYTGHEYNLARLLHCRTCTRYNYKFVTIIIVSIYSVHVRTSNTFSICIG